MSRAPAGITTSAVIQNNVNFSRRSCTVDAKIPQHPHLRSAPSAPHRHLYYHHDHPPQQPAVVSVVSDYVLSAARPSAVTRTPSWTHVPFRMLG